MKIVILTGSAHKRGSSALLAEKFMEGAREAGHEVERIDTAFRSVHPCLGCEKCGMGDNPCVWKDDMVPIGKAIIDADMVVYAFPMYYHGMPAPIKAVHDRIFGIEKHLKGKGKKVAMLVAAADDSERNYAPLKLWLDVDMEYLEWEIVGDLYAGGVWSRADMEKTDFPQQAYEMGRNM